MFSTDRLIEAFNEAKAIADGAERDQFLTELAREDAELQGQVRSLLRAHESAGEFLRARPELAPEIEAELARLKPEEAGQQIGPYKLCEQIGEGGFGVVWVAEQQRPVRRTVALKIIKLGMDTRDVVARFEQERQALAMMDHPNIAKVIDAGATEWGRPFFVMELVRGIRITDYCDQAKLPTVERLALFIQVCHAVQHAHQKGIIHRDLKPSNILVTLHDGVAVPKVIDFGVAKATQGRLGDFSIYTRFQQLVGTPLYMSPEQAEMNGLDVDTRTDIYALGVLLYELLTGRTPFNAEVFLKAGYDEMRRLIREQEPQKPSTALHTMAQAMVTTVAHHRASEPPKLIHAIRGDLDWIVMKTLEKDRARRYDTATGLAADIQRHLDNEPVIARPPSRGYRLQKLVRRNKLAFAAGATIAASLVIGFTTATWMYFRESEARKRATDAEMLARERLAEVSTERDAKEAARQEAEAISTFMSEVFQSPDPARDGRTITVAETLDKAAKKLETELADQPAQQARLQATLGDTYRALGLYRQAVPLGEEALEYHRVASGLDHPDTLTAMRGLAQSYHRAGRWDEAFKLCEEALAHSRELFGDEHDQTIRLMSDLSYYHEAVGHTDEALKLREKVVAFHPKVNGLEHHDTIMAMLSLAQSYGAAGRQDETRKLQEEVLTRCRTVFGPEHPDTLAAMLSLANTYHNTADRRDEGRKLREEMLALSRKVYGPEHPQTLQAMHNLTFSYVAVGRLGEALQLREEVLALDRKVLGPEHPATLFTMHFLADSYYSAGRQDDALKLREEVLALNHKVLGPGHRSTMWTMNTLSKSYFDAGRLDDALKLREEILASSRKTLGPEHPDTLSAMHSLTNFYRAAGRWNEALKLGEEALPLCRKLCGPDHSDTLLTIASLAESYTAVGRQNEVPKLREEVVAIRRRVLGPDHSDTIGAMNHLALSYTAAGRHDEAIRLSQEVISLCSKVRGPVHPDTLNAMNNLATSFQAAGRLDEVHKLREESLKLREEGLALCRKQLGPEHPETLAAMALVTDSYLQAGRVADALSLLADASTRNPENTHLALKLAALQVWFAKDADYAATCLRMLRWATDPKDHGVADRVAKLACLRPIGDAQTQQTTLTLARRSVALGEGKNIVLGYAPMVVGMAEYRSGNYHAADDELTTAAKLSSSGAGPVVAGTASFYRAMSLFQQGKQAAARKLFVATETKMKPLPADETNPLADGKSNADHLILWLAFKEARALLNAPAGK